MNTLMSTLSCPWPGQTGLLVKLLDCFVSCNLGLIFWVSFCYILSSRIKNIDDYISRDVFPAYKSYIKKCPKHFKFENIFMGSQTKIGNKKIDKPVAHWLPRKLAFQNSKFALEFKACPQFKMRWLHGGFAFQCCLVSFPSFPIIGIQIPSAKVAGV